MKLTDAERDMLASVVLPRDGLDDAILVVERILDLRAEKVREAVYQQGASIGRYKAVLSRLEVLAKPHIRTVAESVSNLRHAVALDYERAVNYALDNPEDD